LQVDASANGPARTRPRRPQASRPALAAACRRAVLHKPYTESCAPGAQCVSVLSSVGCEHGAHLWQLGETSMIEPGRILPMYGPLLGGDRRASDPPAREALAVDELATRLLHELGDDARAALRGIARVVARAHQLRCAGD